MKKLLVTAACISLTLLGLTTAQADRSIGNGGGLGEMKLIYLHQHLNQYFRVCLRPSNPCKISKRNLVDFANALEAARQSPPDRLIVNKNGAWEDGIKTEKRVGAPIVVSAASLYQRASNPDYDLKIPLPAAEIAGLLLSAFLTQVSDQPADVLVRLAYDTALGFVEAGTEFQISSHPELTMREHRLGFEGITELVLILEDADKAMNLSEKIAAQLRCPVKTTRFENWRALESQDGKHIYALSDISSRCDGEIDYKTLIIGFEIDDKGLVIENTVRVNVRESI